VAQEEDVQAQASQETEEDPLATAAEVVIHSET
jgi:hypothetical protein